MNPAVETTSLTNRQITAADLLRLFRLILARNPFYILSALLLLLGIRLLSGDSRIFTTETPQLVFNFSSFEFYETLLAGTAILLARRKIWYDSGLLLGIETMFVFVPLILVSQALLISNGIAIILCAAGCALISERTIWLRRSLPGANFPFRLVIFGSLLLLLNVVLPIVTRLLHQHANVAVLDHRAFYIKLVEWYLLMPLFMALALFLPSPPGNIGKEALYSRRHFPLFALSLWIAGTAAHLYCIGFVYGLRWENQLIEPLVWVGAWMLWKRRADLDFLSERCARFIERALFAGPAAVVLAGECAGWDNAAWLALPTMAVYAWIGLAKRRWLALHLAFASMALMVAGLPHDLFVTKASIFSPAAVAAGVAGIYFILLALIWPKPWMGLAGGLALTAITWNIRPGGPVNHYLAVNAGLVFALLHSLRWDGGLRIQKVVAGGWLLQCLCWMLGDPEGGMLGPFASGLSIIAVYFCARAVMMVWGSRLIPWTAMSGMALGPIRTTISYCAHAPEGVLILAGSFVLFGFGTWLALTKARWLPAQNAPGN